LPAGALERDRRVVENVLARPEAVRFVVRQNGRRALIVGPAQQGCLRIVGPQGEFTERTVSLLDLAWVVAAEDDVKHHGGILDEQRINRLRYLEGTPKGSTRWIDTGWAIAIVRSVD
jgi:hypothetical protein